MNDSKQEEHKEQDLIRLWILRMLNSIKLLQKFVKRDHFDEDDIADCLGLHKWIDLAHEDEFKRADILKEIQTLRRNLESRVNTLSPKPEVLRNFQIIRDLFGLSREEQSILQWIVFLKHGPSALKSAIGIALGYNSTRRQFLDLLSRSLRLSPATLRTLLSPEATLIRTGCLRWTNDSKADSITTFHCFEENLLHESLSQDNLLREIATKAPPPTLSHKDFPHLRETLRDLNIYLRTVLRQSRKGVNVLLYGPPGTGKTELSRLLAHELRCPSFEIVSHASSPPRSFRSEPNGSDRLSSLFMAQLLFSKSKTLLVFDEIEDIFRGGSLLDRGVANQSKARMNQLLESNPVPILWISNSNECIDNAFLRRFDFVLEIPPFPVKHREHLYRKICDRAIPTRTLEKLAHCDNLTPALVSRANQVSLAIHDNPSSRRPEKTFIRLIRNTLKAQGHPIDSLDRPSRSVPEIYDVRMLHTDIPLESLPENLTDNRSCRICLYGPPGTGKTTFGHWLARQLESPLHSKKISDIVSPLVGQTERNLARCFLQANEENAILMIDEVDTFLQERRQAVRSWEISQVNELLTQMEQFEGIFIASTNLMDHIDQAALRRFDLKVRFHYLQPQQCRQLLISHCRQNKLKPPSHHLIAQAQALSNATPGDFANAARQHRFRPFRTASEFLAAVQKECTIKEHHGDRPIGFIH